VPSFEIAALGTVEPGTQFFPKRRGNGRFPPPEILAKFVFIHGKNPVVAIPVIDDVVAFVPNAPDKIRAVLGVLAKQGEHGADIVFAEDIQQAGGSIFMDIWPVVKTENNDIPGNLHFPSGTVNAPAATKEDDTCQKQQKSLSEIIPHVSEPVNFLSRVKSYYRTLFPQYPDVVRLDRARPFVIIFRYP
jgi:hypothetical protein